MAEDMGGTTGGQHDENGSKERATVALVDAKVDGLRELIRAEFANVKEDVRALATVVADVIKQGVQIENHERRITAIEAKGKETRDYRGFKLPSLIFTGMTSVAAIVALISQIHFH